MWVDVAAIGAGYMGASLGQSFIEGMVPFDVPNEVYGAGVAYLGYSVDAEYSNKVGTGGALYSLDSGAQRFGLKNAVTQIGGGGD